MEYKYIVVYIQNGEQGWSGPYEHFEEFKTYEEAIEFHDKLNLDESMYDWGTYYKRIYRIRQAKARAS